MVSVPELGIRGSSTANRIKDGKRETSVILLYVPDDAVEGTYDMKISMRNGDITRIKYRQIDII